MTATPAVLHAKISFVKAEAPASDLDGLIAKYAAVYEVPVDLVRRVVKRESTFNPKAYNRGHWGLMQIKHATARGMGYSGPAKGLLDAETNLSYAVKYLDGAWLVANGNDDRPSGFYQRGYYYDAKRKGLLDETGLRRGPAPADDPRQPDPQKGGRYSAARLSESRKGRCSTLILCIISVPQNRFRFKGSCSSRAFCCQAPEPIFQLVSSSARRLQAS